MNTTQVWLDTQKALWLETQNALPDTYFDLATLLNDKDAQLEFEIEHQ